MIMINKKEEMIAQLEFLAEEVKKLKALSENHRNRTIVIEFSGSPKSGKTSCINSLAIFLKRNGFTVHVVEERASVCPVSDKHSPMFNIWTSCMSLANMIGTLEDKGKTIDVLILDRGIFDALCWFQWLSDTGRMEEKLKKSAESFLLQKSFVQNINLVFALEATPDISIKREFANLLTTKTGSIMNIEVLGEYREAIHKTIELHQSDFHRVEQLDTSPEEMDQDNVGRIVTETTLKVLRDQFMEKIGYIRKSEKLSELLSQDSLFNYTDLDKLFQSSPINFDLRNIVEENDDYLQILPIAVVTNDRNEVLVVKKKDNACSVDSPEKGKLLLWVGGHMRASDRINENEYFLDVCKSTLKRELKEELGISKSFDGITPSIIYTPNNPKSSKHLAVCFQIEIDNTAKLKLDPYELVQHKGPTQSGEFLTIDDLKKLKIADLEDWSINILEHYFDITIKNPTPQLGIRY